VKYAYSSFMLKWPVGQKRLCISLWFSFLECIFLETRKARFVNIELLGLGSGHLCGLYENMIKYLGIYLFENETLTQISRI